MELLKLVTSEFRLYCLHRERFWRVGDAKGMKLAMA